MALALGILFALIAMLSWGTADVFAKKAVNRVGYKTSLLLNHIVAFVPLVFCQFYFSSCPCSRPR
jgi:drug/metabolite transporter (DMT)-like permease